MNSLFKLIDRTRTLAVVALAVSLAASLAACVAIPQRSSDAAEPAAAAPLVVEQSQVGARHRDAVLAARFLDLGVADRAARLRDVAHAMLRRMVDVVSKGNHRASLCVEWASGRRCRTDPAERDSYASGRSGRAVCIVQSGF